MANRCIIWRYSARSGVSSLVPAPSGASNRPVQVYCPSANSKGRIADGIETTLFLASWLLPYRSVFFGGRDKENLAHLNRETARFGALARPRQHLIYVSAFQYP